MAGAVGYLVMVAVVTFVTARAVGIRCGWGYGGEPARGDPPQAAAIWGAGERTTVRPRRCGGGVARGPGVAKALRPLRAGPGGAVAARAARAVGVVTMWRSRRRLAAWAAMAAS